MDTLGCAVCRSSHENRLATGEEVSAFWRAKGVDGAPPPDMEVRALLRCTKRIDLPQRDVCDCETAWVRNAPDDDWRPIVRIPVDFVASVSA